MIWHFAELWMLLLASFVVGCLLGVASYALLARGRLATAQGALADSVGDVIDAIKARFGLGPTWRPATRRPVDRPVPAAAIDQDFDNDGLIDTERGDLEDWQRDPVHHEEPDWSGDSDWQDEAESEERVPRTGDGEVEEVEYEAEMPPEDATAMRPAGLSAPRNGVPDNLQRIRGIGQRNEELLNSLGIFHFGQIAAWTPAEVRWVGAYLSFPERIDRDNWIRQATILASGGETGLTKASDRRRARRQQQRESDV